MSDMRCVAIGLVFLTSCGPAYIMLEVQSELDIPTGADELHVVAHVVEAEDALLNKLAPLTAGSSFPLDVLLEPSGGTPEAVLVFRVRALLDKQEVAVGESRAKYEGDDLAVGVVLE